MDDRQEGAPERHFGRYRVKKPLGQGGMGIVYLAEDPGIGREVAIKVLHVDPQTRPDLRAEVQRRFEIEARSAGRLSHPNIVTIHDIGKQGDAPYIAMEFVAGESLEDVLASDRRLTFKETSDLTAQLCRALDYAHAHGIVHRDIKPANVLLAQDGQPKIVDFGVAKMGQALGGDAPRLTQIGTIIGTPAYMSPEQVTGHEVTPASDQFSLAVIVYEMLTGTVPFSGEGATTVMYQIVHGEPRSMHSFNKRLPGSIDAAVFRALAKDPAERYETCSDFARAVREALQSAPDASEVREPPADRTVVLPPSDATIVLPPEPVGSRPAAATIVMPPAGTVADETVVIHPPSTTDRPQAPAPAHEPAPAPVPAPPHQPDAGGAPGSGTVGDLLARLRALPPAVLAGAGAGIVLVLAVAMWALSGSGPAAEAPAAPVPGDGPAAVTTPVLFTGRSPLKPPNTVPLEPLATWYLDITGDPGSELWVDGARSGLAVPGRLELSGRSGDRVALELRRNGSTVASTEISLGAYLQEQWPTPAVASTRRPSTLQPAAPAAERFEVVTRPAGARVRVNGSLVDGVTPLAIEVRPDQRYELSIELDGHDPLAWSFTPGELPETTRTARSLFFPLVATGAPAGRAGAGGGPGSKLSTGSPSSGFAGEGEPLDPIRIRGSRMVPAEVLEKWEPEFPRWARDAGLSSYVILELVIDRQGRLRSANVLREVHPDLERMAIDAVRRWRFQAATNEGAPVDAYFNVSVQFRR